MSNLKMLVSTRKYLRSSVTKIYNTISTFNQMDVISISEMRSKLQSLSTDLDSTDDEIHKSMWAEETEVKDYDKELADCESYQDKIRRCMCELSNIASSSHTGATDVARSLLRSPTAPLPKFDSKDEENIDLFLFNFEQTLSKFQYTDYDRFLLLKQQISGKASFLLESLETNQRTYDAAKTLLQAAFSCKVIQKFNVIKQLSEIKLGFCDEPFKYISDIRSIQQSVTQLKITIDDVLQFFILSGMNETFRNQLVQITNNLRPTLNEINEHFFAANERYNVAQKFSKDRKVKSHNDCTSLAINVKPNESKFTNPFLSCTLCTREGKSDHGINRCTVYKLPKDKLNRLQNLNGCLRCANLDHVSSQCKFRFKKPCNCCSSWHFTFLCSKFDIKNIKESSHENKNKPKDPKYSQKSSQSSIAVVAGACNIPSSNVLATFTCKGDKGLKLRGLMDSGSQCNLVSEGCLEDLNYELIKDNIQFNISGINGSTVYVSKQIRIKLQFGSEILLIDAITLPNINISLFLPGLGQVVSTFINKGYNLADDNLSADVDTIDNIDLILGIDSFRLFCDKRISFGPNKLSVYSQTSFGIMLSGNVEQMLEDIKYLPNLDSDCSESSVLDSANTNITSLLSYNCADNRNFDSKCVESANSFDLEEICDFHLQKEEVIPTIETVELNEKLVTFLIENTKRKTDGRLVMPLLWNGHVSHLLGRNYGLANSILNASKVKLQKVEGHLTLVDDVVKELEGIGAIEKIPDLHKYFELYPSCSFLAHMPIIKLNRETTKCRLVYLSNLCEKNKSFPHAISHNQAMYPGPNLNHKLTTALILLRFDSKLVCFDLKKAFLQIELGELDQSKLLFLWFRNVAKGDFSLQAYKNVRLSFGLRPSPAILMVALYIILILRTEGDSTELKSLKRLIYSLMYMDNGAITGNNTEYLKWAFSQLSSIFNPYKFELQQFASNDSDVQNLFSSEEVVQNKELFGLNWNVKEDVLSAKQKKLDPEANSKRKVLQSIAENFDPYNFDGPVLNRARLFLHEIQLQKELSWDDCLSKEQLKEWKNISKQVNDSQPILIPRFVGKRSESYKLVAFCDSSAMMYGTVVYIYNVNTNQTNFLLAKNRMVTRQLEGKSIPSLELLAILLGVEAIVNLKQELSGMYCLDPVNISELEIYSDSLVALSWIKSYIVDLNKMNKHATFVKNKLEKLKHLTECCRVDFSFVDGITNPADYVTRPVSPKLLSRSNFISGPEFFRNRESYVSKPDIITFSVPRDNSKTNESFTCISVIGSPDSEFIVPTVRFSRFSRFAKVYEHVLTFIYKLRNKIKPNTCSIENVKHDSFAKIIGASQKSNFGEVITYFSKSNPNYKDMPNLVRQLNLFVDQCGLLRVGSKMLKSKKIYKDAQCPILLSKNCRITELLIMEIHEKLLHAGIFSVINELRKKFWVPQQFSYVRKLLKNCIHCRRFNRRPIKLNQSSYKDYRVNPSNIPFANIFMDYIGPYYVKLNGQNCKVWLLCITCLWTRAINLKVSMDLGTGEFLRSFQLHCFEYGMPVKVFSDMGSQLVAGANIISDMLNNVECNEYFRENNLCITSFQQFYKGHSQLGSLVEICVKMTKRLLFAAIKKNILPVRDFEFLVAQAVTLLNRRPVAFKEVLKSNEFLPEAITPQMLIHGHDLLTVNVIPFLQSVSSDPDWRAGEDPVERIRNSCNKLRITREHLIDLYNSDFLPTLITQATNSKDRFSPVTHHGIRAGDIVLIKEDKCKIMDFPMAIVKEVTINDLGEVTGATLRKGSTGEIVKRHSSTIIPLLQYDEYDSEESCEVQQSDPVIIEQKTRRKAAAKSEKLTRKLLQSSD